MPRAITISGDEFSDVAGFIALAEAALGLRPAARTLTELSERLTEPCTVHWQSAARSRTTQVRASDVPLDELPDGGSNMMREIVLDLVYAQVSLYDKITRAFANDPRVALRPDS